MGFDRVFLLQSSAQLLMLVLTACHLQNQTDATVALDSGGGSSKVSSISSLNSLTVLTSPASAQTAFCPSAKVYVDSSLGESLSASCKGCHSQGRNGFDLDPSLADDAAFVELLEYLREKTEDGSRAVDHLLVTKAQGTSHGGGAVWSTSNAKLGHLAQFIQSELEIPCDPDATLRRAEELQGSDDASRGASEDETAVDEEW